MCWQESLGFNVAHNSLTWKMFLEILATNGERQVGVIQKENKQIGNSAPRWRFPHIVIEQKLKLLGIKFQTCNRCTHFTTLWMNKVSLPPVLKLLCCVTADRRLGPRRSSGAVSAAEVWARCVLLWPVTGSVLFQVTCQPVAFCSRWPRRALRFTWPGRSAGLRGLSLPATINRVGWRKNCDLLMAFIHAGLGQQRFKLPGLIWGHECF